MADNVAPTARVGAVLLRRGAGDQHRVAVLVDPAVVGEVAPWRHEEAKPIELLRLCLAVARRSRDAVVSVASPTEAAAAVVERIIGRGAWRALGVDGGVRTTGPFRAHRATVQVGGRAAGVTP